MEEYKAALLAAPWWADAYKKLAMAQKAAEKYDDAVASLNFYLLTQPADARDAQDEIYKLKALKESAADDRKLAEQKAAEEQQRRQRRKKKILHRESSKLCSGRSMAGDTPVRSVQLTDLTTTP